MVNKIIHKILNTTLPFKKLVLGICIIIGTFSLANGQAVCIDTTGANPNASAILDISSTTRGLLIPRMSTVQMNAIVAPDTALMVFNTDDSCVFYFTGPPLNSWQSIYCPCKSSPGTPGAITGNTYVCSATSQTYSVAAVPDASLYTWTGPNGSVITSGQGTNSIIITIGSNPGNISVVATNNCGSSAVDTLAITLAGLHGLLTFTYEDGVQTWTVPPCVSVITLNVNGAQGGYGGFDNSPICMVGGNGGSVVGTLNVVGGTVLNIYTGGQGTFGVMAQPGAGGWNGGGNGFYVHSQYSGGGGGGASDVRIGGNALANRVVVAGGGGGAGCDHLSAAYDNGGPGGAATSAAGAGYFNNIQGGAKPGAGGTAAIGGAGGTGACTAGSGILGIGGNACATSKNGGGGGGGGYYGGGAGFEAGGGGGSNYTGGLTTVTSNISGANSGNGSVTIQW